MKCIASDRNPAFRAFRALAKARAVKKKGLALLSGPKQISEVWRDFPERCAGMICSSQHTAADGLMGGDAILYLLEPHLFREIDLFGTDYPILLVRVDPLPKWSNDSRMPGCTLLLPFQDPSNVGAVIRSAAAFGAARVVMLTGAAHPYHPRSLRAAGSNLLRIPIFQGPSMEALGVTAHPLITLAPGGKDAASFSFPENFCLLPGREGQGVSETLSGHAALSIPMTNKVESLNAALAAGIVLYLWKRGLSSGN